MPITALQTAPGMPNANRFSTSEGGMPPAQREGNHENDAGSAYSNAEKQFWGAAAAR